MIDKVKDLRISIEVPIQLIGTLKPIKKIRNDIVGQPIDDVCEASRELIYAQNSLKMAKGWLGKVLQTIGEESPYQNDGKRKEVGDIEPSAESVELILETTETPMSIKLPNGTVQSIHNSFANKNYIERIDFLREGIKQIIDSIELLQLSIQLQPNAGDFLMDNIFRNLNEARFWLGFELGRIREESNK